MFRTESAAKINWFLSVLGKREDGFHEIRSVMQKISLSDVLTFEEADRVELSANITITDNIILRTIGKLRQRKKRAEKGIRIVLRKVIPLAAGLGGGSSNAATVLVGLNKLWGLMLTHDELIGIAASLGSDVPFFLGGNCSSVSGRGEIISPCAVTREYDLLLVNPGIAISSAWAYQQTREYAQRDEDMVAPFIDALNRRDFSFLDEHMVNSLETPVFQKYPVIREIKEALREQGARLSLMSGSGSTVFGVFDDEESARSARSYFEMFWTGVVKTRI